IARALVRDPQQRAERLGEIFLACETVANARPAEFRDSLAGGALESFLLPHVRDSLTSELQGGPRGGWLGTFIEADGRARPTTPTAKRSS
ncbi:MAG: hypothetical protein JRG82_11330, partial [Deltaproteobacteria bacterium]|nr:hypothetical protein [Deltaproteobacteria bacterium]